MATSTMVVETVFTEGVAHLSYLIGDKATGKAAVIDPRRDVEVYIELARKNKLSITHVLETHIHADFVSGTRELIDRTGTARAVLSVEGGAKYGFECDALKDGDKIDLGRVILTAKHTPGHTPEHMSFLAAESNRAETPFAVFSGDTLFADSVGRPDLLGASQSEKLAHQLFASLREFYLKLRDGVRVHPAHGAGSPCGADIADRLVTTIGYERTHNKALQFTDEAAFVEFALGTAPPEPVYYKRMKKINAEGPEVLGRLPTCPPVIAKEFQKAVAAKGSQLVDNRQMLAFGGGHIKGALSIGPHPKRTICGLEISPRPSRSPRPNLTRTSSWHQTEEGVRYNEQGAIWPFVFREAHMFASDSNNARHGGQDSPSDPHLPSILIADDSHDSANTLRSLFDAHGYKTHVAYDGVAALEAAKAHLPDVILLDLGMPEMDGVHLARFFREDRKLKDKVLIAITGHADEMHRSQCEAVGIDYVFPKPVAWEDLISTIDRLWSERKKP